METLVEQQGIQASAASAIARLIRIDASRVVALPPHTTLEIIENPSCVPVPGSAHYGCGLMHWQGRWLPVLRLGLLLGGQVRTSAAFPAAQGEPVRYALVVAYQRFIGEPIEYGALATDFLPDSVPVRAQDACALPGDDPLLNRLALSCFRHEGRAVPIIHVGRLFADHHCQ